MADATQPKGGGYNTTGQLHQGADVDGARGNNGIDVLNG